MKTLSIIIIAIVLFASCNQAETDKKSKEKFDKSVKKIQKLPALSNDTVFDFENYEADKIPENWSEYFTGKGDKTKWKIVDDNGNKVLAQLSQGSENYHFNEIVFNGFKAKNVKLEVRMKGVKGKMDQGGGFVWRFIDKDNYYVVRANPLEDNVVLYKVEKGIRTDLAVLGKGRTYGMEVPPLGNGWNNLKLMVVDDLFIVYLNFKEIFRVKDSTFMQAGKVGLWTKADAVSYFDDFMVKVK